MAGSLDGVWAKIDRAKEHRDALDTYIRDTLAVKDHRPSIAIKLDTKTLEHVAYISAVPDYVKFLKRSALIIGDIVHNLRGALDYLTYELARWNTKGNVKQPRLIQFPIAHSPKLFFEEAFTKRHRLCEIDGGHAAEIEGLQPYHGRHIQLLPEGPLNPLALLRDTSNTDKHRLLTPVLLVPSGFGVSEPLLIYLTFEATKQGRIRAGEFRRIRVELGAELVRAKLPDSMREVEMDMTGYLTFQVSFSEGWSVIVALDHVTMLVEDVIHRFERVF